MWIRNQQCFQEKQESKPLAQWTVGHVAKTVTNRFFVAFASLKILAFKR
jgi:hypothetical protein